MNQVYNNLYGTNRNLEETAMIEDDEYQLFNFKDSGMFYYWLATPEENQNKIYYMSDINIKSQTNVRLGIRPVIYLKDGLK